jgi:hypothetical protein
VLERVIGPGMAAPETSGMRRLRIAVTGVAALLCTGLLGIDGIVSVVGPVMTGAIFAGLLVATLAPCGVWLVVKTRRDAAWLDHLIAQGAEP